MSTVKKFNVNESEAELNEYVESSDWIYTITDSDKKVIFGVTSDGDVEWQSGIPTPIENELDSLKDNISSLDNVINNVDNTLYMTISEDEELLEKTEDSNGIVISKRTSDGTLYENDINAKDLYVCDIDACEVNAQVIKVNDLELRQKSDLIKNLSVINNWSDETDLQLPMPSVIAKVNIKSTALPTTKTSNIEAILEFSDMSGNYFSKPIIINCQGTSSMSYSKKNFAIDFKDESKIKFGKWVSQDSFHLKAYWIDSFRGKNNIAYNLMEEMYQTYPVTEQRPWDYLNNQNITVVNSNGILKSDFWTGALAHPDGFPALAYHNDQFIGIYVWNLKKHRDNYFCDKSNPLQIILDGELGASELFCDNADNIDWPGFEIRNPKDLINTSGTSYVGGNVLSDTDTFSKQTKDAIRRLSESCKIIRESDNPKEKFAEYFLVDFIIDYFIVSNILYHYDGFRKNWIWCTWDGLKWTPTLYDADSIFGQHWNGSTVVNNGNNELLGGSTSIPTGFIPTYYKDELEARYKELRDKNIISTENIIRLTKEWIDKIGFENYKKEFELYPTVPSYSSGGFYDSLRRTKLWLDNRISAFDAKWNYTK